MRTCKAKFNRSGAYAHSRSSSYLDKPKHCMGMKVWWSYCQFSVYINILGISIGLSAPLADRPYFAKVVRVPIPPSTSQFSFQYPRDSRGLSHFIFWWPGDSQGLSNFSLWYPGDSYGLSHFNFWYPEDSRELSHFSFWYPSDSGGFWYPCTTTQTFPLLVP